MRRTLIAIGMAGVCLVWAGPAWATFPGANGRIAFGYSDGTHVGNAGSFVVTMEPDGSDVRYLRHGGDPAWSAKGRRIAFVRTVDNQAEIFTMRVDGTNLRRRTFMPNSNDSEPAFSPNGTRIVFTSVELPSSRHSHARVISMRSDGSDRQVLTWNGIQPEWAPDGRHIVYEGGGIRIMRPDGTHKQGLYTPSQFLSFLPHYIPDSHSIVFGRCRIEGRDCGETEWMQMGARGGNPHRLPISSDVFEVQPSPEGNCFVGWRWRDNEGRNIYTSGLGCPIAGWLTNYPGPQAAVEPSWQPLP